MSKSYSKLTRIADSITFPFRALFMGEEGRFGLSSLTEERMRFVAPFCKGKTLDVGCGPHNLFIRDFIGYHRGVGIDIFPYPGVENIVKDMRHIPFKDSSFDTITLIAVGGHIPQEYRKDEFKEFSRLLKKGGLLMVTEGEMITQWLGHKWWDFYNKITGKKTMDTVRGMQEGEQYCIPRKELLSYLNTSPLKFIKRKRFMWCLNNVYIAKKVTK